MQPISKNCLLLGIGALIVLVSIISLIAFSFSRQGAHVNPDSPSTNTASSSKSKVGTVNDGSNNFSPDFALLADGKSGTSNSAPVGSAVPSGSGAPDAQGPQGAPGTQSASNNGSPASLKEKQPSERSSNGKQQVQISLNENPPSGGSSNGSAPSGGSSNGNPPDEGSPNQNPSSDSSSNNQPAPSPSKIPAAPVESPSSNLSNLSNDESDSNYLPYWDWNIGDESSEEESPSLLYPNVEAKDRLPSQIQPTSQNTLFSNNHRSALFEYLKILHKEDIVSADQSLLKSILIELSSEIEQRTTVLASENALRLENQRIFFDPIDGYPKCFFVFDISEFENDNIKRIFIRAGFLKIKYLWEWLKKIDLESFEAKFGYVFNDLIDGEGNENVKFQYRNLDFGSRLNINELENKGFIDFFWELLWENCDDAKKDSDFYVILTGKREHIENYGVGNPESAYNSFLDGSFNSNFLYYSTGQSTLKSKIDFILKDSNFKEASSDLFRFLEKELLYEIKTKVVPNFFLDISNQDINYNDFDICFCVLNIRGFPDGQIKKIFMRVNEKKIYDIMDEFAFTQPEHYEEKKSELFKNIITGSENEKLKFEYEVDPSDQNLDPNIDELKEKGFLDFYASSGVNSDYIVILTGKEDDLRGYGLLPPLKISVPLYVIYGIEPYFDECFSTFDIRGFADKKIRKIFAFTTESDFDGMYVNFKNATRNDFETIKTERFGEMTADAKEISNVIFEYYGSAIGPQLSIDEFKKDGFIKVFNSLRNRNINWYCSSFYLILTGDEDDLNLYKLGVDNLGKDKKYFIY